LEKFVFYDLETTGISPAFDQPLQFAAIVTDLELNEIERVDIRCQLSPHILPSPKALAVTGVRPSQLENNNLPSAFEFAQTIQKFTEQWAPAIWIGYNSIAFDEAMLRQMFYQNLQPNIFATQFHNNTRLDVMKMIFAVHAEAPEVLKWPINDKGKVSFKLDQLAPLNGFHAHNAHDALGDVEATIFIVDLIKTQRPELYQNCLTPVIKSTICSLLRSFKPVDVTLRFGGNAPKTYTGCFCGLPENNKNMVGFFDLNQADPMGLIHGTEQEILEAMTKSPQRIRSLRLNQGDTIRPASTENFEWNHICAVIEGNEAFQAMVSNGLDNKYSDAEDIDLLVEEKIFAGFYSHQDKELLQNFQTSNWAERLALLTGAQDDRIQQLGRRLVAFNARHLLDDKYQNVVQEYLADKWSANEPDVRWTTIASVRLQLIELEEDGFDKSLLNEMRAFYRNRIKAQGCSVDF